MSDPSWLPSAIMQTVGALYAIFIACFVLVIQNMSEIRKTVEFHENIHEALDNHLKNFNNLFKVLTVVVVLTELYNGLFLYYILESGFTKFPLLLLGSYFTFSTSIFYIAAFSYYLTAFIIQYNKQSIRFIADDFPHMGDIKFIMLVILIFLISSIIAIFINGSINTTWVIILCVVVFIVVMRIYYHLIGIFGKVTKYKYSN